MEGWELDHDTKGTRMEVILGDLGSSVRRKVQRGLGIGKGVLVGKGKGKSLNFIWLDRMGSIIEYGAVQ